MAQTKRTPTPFYRDRDASRSYGTKHHHSYRRQRHGGYSTVREPEMKTRRTPTPFYRESHGSQRYGSPHPYRQRHGGDSVRDREIRRHTYRHRRMADTAASREPSSSDSRYQNPSRPTTNSSRGNNSRTDGRRSHRLTPTHYYNPDISPPRDPCLKPVAPVKPQGSGINRNNGDNSSRTDGRRAPRLIPTHYYNPDVSPPRDPRLKPVAPDVKPPPRSINSNHGNGIEAMLNFSSLSITSSEEPGSTPIANYAKPRDSSSSSGHDRDIDEILDLSSLSMQSSTVAESSARVDENQDSEESRVSSISSSSRLSQRSPTRRSSVSSRPTAVPRSRGGYRTHQRHYYGEAAMRHNDSLSSSSLPSSQQWSVHSNRSSHLWRCESRSFGAARSWREERAAMNIARRAKLMRRSAVHVANYVKPRKEEVRQVVESGNSVPVLSEPQRLTESRTFVRESVVDDIPRPTQQQKRSKKARRTDGSATTVGSNLSEQQSIVQCIESPSQSMNVEIVDDPMHIDEVGDTTLRFNATLGVFW